VHKPFVSPGRLIFPLVLLVAVSTFRMSYSSTQTGFQPVAVQMTSVAQSGVVVEEVKPASAGPGPGLESGDVIVSWSRGPESGKIESPFDWTRLWVEQVVRGGVTVRGFRDSHDKSWIISDTIPNVVVRPVLGQDQAKVWQHCRELEKARRFAEAAGVWRVLTGQVQKDDPPWWSSWLQSQLAQSLTGARQFEEAEITFRRAIDQARLVGGTATTHLCAVCGDAFMVQGNWTRAEECYRMALEEAHKLSSHGLMEARSLASLGGLALRRGDLARAEQYYQQALAIDEKLAPDSFAVVWTLTGIANVASARRDLGRAAEYQHKSLAIDRKLSPGSLSMAMLLHNLGSIARNRMDLATAEDYYRQALAIDQKLAPGGLGVAGSLNTLGDVARERGDLARAEEYGHQALTIEQRLAPESLDLARTLNSLGNVARDRGDLAHAEENYLEALTIYQRLTPESFSVAWALSNLGSVAYWRGDLVGAERYLEQTMAILQRAAPGSLPIAEVLTDLGTVARERSDLAQAEKYYQQALAIREKLAPESSPVAESLSNLGSLPFKRGDLVHAEEYWQQTLAIREKAAPASLSVAEGLSNLGSVAYRRGDLVAAERYLDQALAISQRIAPASLSVANILQNLGAVALRRGDFTSVDTNFRKTLMIEENLVPGSLAEAYTLHFLGRALSTKGSVDAASYLARAVDALENQTAHLGGTEDIQSSFRAKYAVFYRELEDALLAQKQPQEAYRVSERYRARSLLHMLAERDLMFAAEVPAEFQRARKENAAEYDRVQMQIGMLDPDKDQKKIGELVNKLRDLSDRRGQISEQIKKASPRFAALQYPQPLDLAETRKVLDPGTTLLSYSVGEDHTVLFVVQPAGVEPGLSVLTLPVKEKEWQKKTQEFRRLIAQHRQAEDFDLTAASRGLYDLLLKPAESLLTKSNRLLIVSDGPLQVLPFAALMRNEKEYLVEWKALHTVVSATVYGEIRKMRHPVENKATDLVAFGDPRLAVMGKSDVQRTSNTELRFASERGFSFTRLPFSRLEVESIVALDPKHSRAYLGADATEERAKSLGKNVRYLHFATHGLLDEKFPLNSALVLTMPENVEAGKENGLLQAWEIFEQVRLDADLVTLSACNTGLGQELSGEGLIGLTRAFQYAGARSILASLWSVDDLRTMQLMKSFYSRLRAGASKDEALRQAEIDLLHTRASANPYYWAAFSLAGDWQ
jgi:CHAT domain-containing protein/Tfp pilus assembly protein PilF